MMSMLNASNAAYSAYENIVVSTQSHPNAFPSALKMKKATLTKIHEGADLGTKVRAIIRHAQVCH